MAGPPPVEGPWADTMVAPPHLAGPPGADGGPWGPSVSPVAPAYGAYPQPGYAPSQAPAKKKSPLVLILIIALAVLLAGAIIYFVVIRNNDGGGGGGGGTVNASSPEDAITGFLEAVAASDAEAALAYFTSPPTDLTFITNDVLARSAELGTITGITFPEGSVEMSPGDRAWVNKMTYKIGQNTITASYSLEKVGDKWLIEDQPAGINLQYYATKNLGMTLNGVKIDDLNLSQRYPLLPGMYQFDVSHPLYKVSQGQFSVGSSANTSSLGSRMVVLADDAPAKLEAAATAKLDSCLAAKEFTPTGCGFRIPSLPNQAQPDPSTITRTLTSGDFSGVPWSTKYDSPWVIRGYMSLRFESHVQDYNGNPYSGTSSLSSIEIDAKNPEQLLVTFS